MRYGTHKAVTHDLSFCSHNLQPPYLFQRCAAGPSSALGNDPSQTSSASASPNNASPLFQQMHAGRHLASFAKPRLVSSSGLSKCRVQYDQQAKRCCPVGLRTRAHDEDVWLLRSDSAQVWSSCPTVHTNAFPRGVDVPDITLEQLTGPYNSAM